MKDSLYRSQISIIIGLLSLTLAIIIVSKPVTAQISEPQAQTDASSIYLPVVLKNFDSTLGTPLFGVQMYGSTTETSTYYMAAIESKASWVRVAINWLAIEPTNVLPEAYNWSSADNALAISRQDMGALNVIGTIASGPGWAASIPGGPIDQPNGLTEFVQFVGAVVERYDGDGIEDAPGSPIINYWEFYNEPDAGDDAWGHYGQEYAAMLASVYPVVKAANSEALVVLGGIAYDWFEDQNGPFVREFIDDVLTAGGGNYFDIMNFHAYPVFSTNWTSGKGPGLLQKAQAIRSKLTQYNFGTKPVIITEAGWHSNNTYPIHPASEQIQARYVVELFTQSMAADIDVMIWWMLYDPGGGAWNNGLVTNETPPVEKLAFYAYRTLVSELSTAHFKQILSQTETGTADMEVYQFNDYTYNRDVYVAWMDPVDTAVTQPLKLSGTQATIRQFINGTTQIITDSNDGVVDGKVTVQITADPIYMEISK